MTKRITPLRADPTQLESKKVKTTWPVPGQFKTQLYFPWRRINNYGSLNSANSLLQ